MRLSLRHKDKQDKCLLMPLYFVTIRKKGKNMKKTS